MCHSEKIVFHGNYSKGHNKLLIPVSAQAIYGSFCRTKSTISNIVYYKTIGELVGTDPKWLKSILKKQGEIMWGFANGIDFSPVLASPPANKEYGNSTMTPYDVLRIEDANKVLPVLAETVGNRLRTDDVQIEVIAVGIRY